MKIAIMMRAIDQPSAWQTFVECLVEKILQIDKANRYVLIYRTDKWYGRFSSYGNAKEVLVKAANKFLWDQIAVPLRAWKENVDLIHNPKFSVPLISHCPVTMGIAEMGWRIWPEYYEKLDVIYQKIMFAIYCKKSKHLFPRSQFQLNEIRKYLGRDLANSTVTPYAPKKYFQTINDSNILDSCRDKYNLPEKFIFCVTRVDHPGLDNSNSFFPGKNVDTAVKAYIQCRDQFPHQLVIAGRRVKEYLLSKSLSKSDFKGIHFLGFVPHNELPLLFNLAQLFVMPSFFEGFGLSLLEAMACGCPSVVSMTGSCPEVGGEAVIQADPYNPDDFAEKILYVLNDNEILTKLRELGLRRASSFTWERSAMLTINALRKVAGNTAMFTE